MDCKPYTILQSLVSFALDNVGTWYYKYTYILLAFVAHVDIGYFSLQHLSRSLSWQTSRPNECCISIAFRKAKLANAAHLNRLR